MYELSGASANISLLLSLAEGGLSHSSVKVCSSPISAYHENIDRHTVFLELDSKCFLKGLLCLFPPLWFPLPGWDLPLVLHVLTQKPFKPLATYLDRLLAWKTVFLVVILSAWRVSELVALWHDLPYMHFSDAGVTLATGVSFVPKVVSEFHLSSDISFIYGHFILNVIQWHFFKRNQLVKKKTTTTVHTPNKLTG